MKSLAFTHYLRVGIIQPKKHSKHKEYHNLLFLVKKLSYTGKESKTTAYSTAHLVEKNPHHWSVHKSLQNKLSRCLAFQISDVSWFPSLSSQIAYFYNSLFSVKMLQSKPSPECTAKVLDRFSFYFTVSPRLIFI